MKIIATLSFMADFEQTKQVINTCYKYNVNDFRINIDKINEETDFQKAKWLVDYIRKNKKNKLYIDLAYPKKKLRITLKKQNDRYPVVKGQVIALGNRRSENDNVEGTISIDNFLDYFTFDREYYFADGLGVLKVIGIDERKIRFVCLNNFELQSGKSIGSNKLQDTSLTEQLIEVLNYCNPENIMLSFVENTEFISELMTKIKCESTILCKIETKKGIENVKDICNSGYGIVVARGDLGLNVNICQLPVYQKKLIDIASEHKSKIFIATDILTSMKMTGIPSRSDIFDLYNIIHSNITGFVLNPPVLYEGYGEKCLQIINQMLQFSNC